MTRSALFLSEQAEADLVDIWVYIAEDSPSIADTFVQRLFEKCMLLAETPTLGRTRPELGAGICSFPFKRYVIYYRQQDARIEVVRILSAYRDLDALI